MQIPEQYAEFADLFIEDVKMALLAHHPWDHKIKLVKREKPTYRPIYCLSKHKLKVLKDYIKTNLQKRFIQKLEFFAEYQILFVPKKNGTLQMCVDYQQLNRVIVKNWYALSLILELHDQFYKAKMFFKINLQDAYHRTCMKEDKEWKSAFQTRYGHYKYTVMPFELINALASMQKLMDDTLQLFLN